MSGLSIATCTYQEFVPGMGAPTRTTAGHPRFALGYQLAGHAVLVTPDRQLVKAAHAGLPEDAYEFQYRRQLATFGVDRIRAELAAIARYFGAPGPVVLLCFDKLTQPGNWCHRTHFAKWWTEQTGDPVPELGGRPTAPASPPPTLFDLS
ncbi:hypothetical protein OG216_19475 [Streptomycetaceae bacterium NBC_01309]